MDVDKSKHDETKLFSVEFKRSRGALEYTTAKVKQYTQRLNYTSYSMVHYLLAARAASACSTASLAF